MLQKLLDHSPDLQRLVTEGYELEIRGAFALVHHIPYVNEKKEISYGTLVSPLTLSGDATKRPESHVIHFIGEQPCDKEGNKMTYLMHPNPPEDINLGEGIVINRSFSNKPANGYPDFYEKFVQYIKVISSPAISLDKNVTAQTYRTVTEEHVSVFQYEDSNSARASIGGISEKLKNQNIGIIGLGGSGSYVLDLVAKCPVQSIHLYDGDKFFQHNAFRAPGAATFDEIKQCDSKVHYFTRMYSKMHKNIIPHDMFVHEQNVAELDGLDFVFLCVDKGDVKKVVSEYLLHKGVPFVDSGIDVMNVDDTLLGQVRTTIVSPECRDGLATIDMSADERQDEAYRSNIQIAELNALSACMAVLKWKKYCGFYQAVRRYCVDVYSMNDGELFHESKESL